MVSGERGQITSLGLQNVHPVISIKPQIVGIFVEAGPELGVGMRVVGEPLWAAAAPI